MYPQNSNFVYWEVEQTNGNGGTTTIPINGKILTLQTNYDSGNPEYQIYCDDVRIFEQVLNAPNGVSNILPIFKICGNLSAHLAEKGEVDLYFSFATSAPVYNVTIANVATSSASSTYPQYTQGDFFTQFLLIIMVSLMAFGGIYRGIFGERVTPNYK